jgi:serine/threonine protein kinase
MTLEVDSRLGPNEILALLGAGGIGEVYRARDTRLDRSAASKVPGGVLTADASCRIRFKREAKAISAYIPRTRAGLGICGRIVERHGERIYGGRDANRHGASLFTLSAIP